jgi:serine kinase of HPr protein (carbohydrate metabolism regulator)
VQGTNLHATAVLLGDRGVLIAAESGSGKTRLALSLIDHFRRAGQFSRLVCDDQVLLSGRNGRLLCRAPDAIAGLVEVYGVGPQPVAFESAMVADLLVRLVADTVAQRFQEEKTESLAGCRIPCLEFGAGSVETATWALASRFSIPPFRSES